MVRLTHELTVLPSTPAEGSALPPALLVKEARAAAWFSNFFTANIRNKNSSRVYYNAIGKFAVHRMTQQDDYRIIAKHARRLGIATRIGNHILRGAELTDYLRSGSTLEHTRKTWPATPPREPPSCMIVAATKPRSTSTRE